MDNDKNFRLTREELYQIVWSNRRYFSWHEEAF